jgi:transposase
VRTQSLLFPADTGRPGYHPPTLLKIYIYGYLNWIQSSRRLERKAQRNVEVVWLTGPLTRGFKTIADFRKVPQTTGVARLLWNSLSEISAALRPPPVLRAASGRPFRYPG